MGWKQGLDGSLTWRDEDAVGESVIWRREWGRPTIQHVNFFGYELSVWSGTSPFERGAPPTRTHTHTHKHTHTQNLAEEVDTDILLGKDN